MSIALSDWFSTKLGGKALLSALLTVGLLRSISLDEVIGVVGEIVLRRSVAEVLYRPLSLSADFTWPGLLSVSHALNKMPKLITDKGKIDHDKPTIIFRMIFITPNYTLVIAGRLRLVWLRQSSVTSMIWLWMKRGWAAACRLCEFRRV